MSVELLEAMALSLWPLYLIVALCVAGSLVGRWLDGLPEEETR